MFSKRYRRITFVALVLAVWLASVAYRNRDNPQVRHLRWDYDGPTCIVEYEIWNPRNQPVYARTLTRLVTDGSEDGRGVLFGNEKEVTFHMEARSQIKVKEHLQSQIFGKPEVRVFLVAGPGSNPTGEPRERQVEVTQKTLETNSGYHAARRSLRGDTAR